MASEPMKPPTTGERLMWGAYVCDDAERLATYRSSNVYMRVIERHSAAAIDKAIADAVAKERERILLVLGGLPLMVPPRAVCAEMAAVLDYRQRAVIAIRAGGNEQPNPDSRQAGSS